LKFFLNNGDDRVGGHGAPDLRLVRVRSVAQKLLYAQVLFDTFEEQIDLPAAFEQSINGQGRQGGVVGQEDQSLLGCWVIEPYTAQVFGVVLRNVVPVQIDGLIADKIAAPAQLGRVYARVHVAFGTGHKEGASLRHLKQAGKVDVAAVQHIERPWLQDQDVQHIDLVHLALLMWIKAGIEPLRSSIVCNFTAALALRNGAHSNRLRHRSIVVASKA
jgi:hypothetical protein